VLLGQMQSTKAAASIGSTIADALYDASTRTIDPPSGNVVKIFEDPAMIYTWMQDLVHTIFPAPTCGDQICEAPEECVAVMPAPTFLISSRDAK
jgi:predicted Abi (CAAX) family protease